eukprot:TRINITY_DN12830_c0_g1_i1.p1 TRINITY_DN12830_c0_g1~~TRINITY_DN12830_c0_g1_i1.p1  ORF type:complete len:1498 (-),score=351.74 TRINITY_DN12830_c0_g1_i1:53-4546(-)
MHQRGRGRGSARSSWASEGQSSRSEKDSRSSGAGGWSTQYWDDSSWQDQSWHKEGEKSYDRYDKSYRDKSYHDKSYYDKSYHDKSYHDKSYHDKSYHDKSYADKSYEKDNEKWRGKGKVSKDTEHERHEQWQKATGAKPVENTQIPPPPPPPPPPAPAPAVRSRPPEDRPEGEKKPNRRGGRKKKSEKSIDEEDDDHADNEPDSEPPLGSGISVQALGPQEVHGAQLSGKECLQTVIDYVKRFPLDSFGVGSHVRNPEKSDLFEEKDNKGKLSLTLHLPACCPIRLALEEPIEASSPEVVERAREKLAARALQKLPKSEIWPEAKTDRDDEPDKDSPAFEIQNGTAGTEQRAILFQQISEWPETVQFYKVDADDGHSWGLATTSPANFSYQLVIKDAVLRLEAMTASWNAAHAKHVLQFQEYFISRGPEERLEMAVVKVDRVVENVATLDFDGMQARPSYVPEWFEDLIKKMERISWWENVRRRAPTEPSPSPWKLHVIFDAPILDSDEKEFEEARQCLAELGADALRLAAAVAKSEEKPWVASSELEKSVEEFLQPAALADLMVKTGLPQMGSRQGIRQEDAAQMLLALVGTHKLESDMFSVVRLWQWVARDKTDEGDPTGEKALLKANNHTAGCPRYLGRTPSYMEFGEVVPPEGEEDTGKQLMVRYEEYDDAFYRWNGSKAEEKRPEIPNSGWMRLVWDPILGTFCSPSMLLADGRHRPLPNKVCAWLRGRQITKLVSIKHSMEVTPPYVSLMEDGDRLTVAYKDHGDICYRRSDGGLGVEITTIGEKVSERNLSYSESKKTLLSQVITGSPLPRKVVTWLLEGRCLADLIPGRKKVSADVDTSEEGIAGWYFEDKRYRVQVRKKKPQYGVIYELESGEALTYSEEKKEWIFDRERPDSVVPCEAISHIAVDTKAASNAEYEVASGAVTRLNTPTSVRLLFPQLSGTVLAEIEQQTDHRFKSPKLLAEALTHCSATRAATPSCEHLAFVGEVALKAYASEKICRSELNSHVSFFTAPMVVREGIPHARSFCAPAGWPAWGSTKRSQGERASKNTENRIDSFQAMQRRLQACCNHVSYAHSCVKLSLHTAINESSKDLKDAVRKFASRVLREQEVTAKWHYIFKSGAPKVLGDVFLACVGAIVMDSDHMEAENLLAKHCNEWKDFYDLLPMEMPKYDLVSLDELRVTFDMFWRAAGRSGISRQLAPWVPSKENLEDEQGARADWHLAKTCTDICLLEVRGEGGGLVCCASPRAAVIGFSLSHLQGLSQSEGSEPEGCASGLEAGRSPAEDAPKAPPEQEGAIYCRHCEMWLNGPTQWADHEIGKKHRKAVRRTQDSGPSASGAEAKKVEGPPAMSPPSAPPPPPPQLSPAVDAGQPPQAAPEPQMPQFDASWQGGVGFDPNSQQQMYPSPWSGEAVNFQQWPMQQSMMGFGGAQMWDPYWTGGYNGYNDGTGGWRETDGDANPESDEGKNGEAQDDMTEQPERDELSETPLEAHQ